MHEFSVSRQKPWGTIAYFLFLIIISSITRDTAAIDFDLETESTKIYTGKTFCFNPVKYLLCN